MNPETEKNVNEAIDWLQKTGGSIQDFAVEQAPLYCREIVAWELWGGITHAIMGIALLLFVRFFWKLTAKVWNTDQYGNPAAAAPAIACISCIVCGSLLIFHGTPQAIKAGVAPRLVIVEHLRGLK